MGKIVKTQVETSYTCDGCGLVTEHHPMGSWASVNPPLRGVQKKRGTLDYCPECSPELEAFLADLKKRRAV